MTTPKEALEASVAHLEASKVLNTAMCADNNAQLDLQIAAKQKLIDAIPAPSPAPSPTS